MYCSKQDTAESEYAVCRTAPNKNCRPCIETCSPIQGFHLITVFLHEGPKDGKIEMSDSLLSKQSHIFI